MVLAVLTDENKTEGKAHFVIRLLYGQQAAAALSDRFVGVGPSFQTGCAYEILRFGK
jgi:hypothetical protein